ncbi:septum formation protein Maf [bacterium]|nr:MAG: septum formation protein Maf [bacterium]
MPLVESSVVRLTLVSASPRRKELLLAAGYSFDVAPAHVTEIWSDRDPVKLAIHNAEKKVRASDFFGNREKVLIGADTIIAFDDQVFGKPVGIESARRMLTTLSGRTHQVITGICLSGPDPDSEDECTLVSSAAVSHVKFRVLSPVLLKEYLDSSEWKGKAGAYAIQGLGAKLVDKLTGDYENVVGLPMTLLKDVIAQNFSHCILQP